jgi:hypothetical protein
MGTIGSPVELESTVASVVDSVVDSLVLVPVDIDVDVDVDVESAALVVPAPSVGSSRQAASTNASANTFGWCIAADDVTPHAACGMVRGMTGARWLRPTMASTRR